MSLWLCPDHGLTGPMPCCSRGERAEIAGLRPLAWSWTTSTSGDVATLYAGGGNSNYAVPDSFLRFEQSILRNTENA